jgi:hypothetical protein
VEPLGPSRFAAVQPAGEGEDRLFPEEGWRLAYGAWATSLTLHSRGNRNSSAGSERMASSCGR